MPLVRRELPALYNGVSQQPTPLRLTSQAEVNINCYSSVVDGVGKRPPFQELAIVSNSAYGAAFISTINRSLSEQYTVVITNGNIQVFANSNGAAKTVNFPHGTGYIATASPQTDINVVTVADYSFILNKNVVVAMGAPGADTLADPNNYANIPFTSFNGGPYQQYSPNIAGTVVRGTVQTFAALPGQPGVAGSPPATNDIYFVQGSSTDTGFGGFYVIWSGGVWNETVNPAGPNSLDATTMPWALIHNADDTFTFTPFSWKPRVVGDKTLNPNPSFVGRKLRDIFFAHNRLGVTADQNCIFSAVGDFGNFYRLTVMDLLASDVVDLAVSSTAVSFLNFGVPFYNNFMLFSDQAQFQLNVVGGMLTPTTVSLDTVTSYQMSTVARPVSIGSDVYFVSEKSNFATLWDYFIRSDVIVNTAEDITAHVPRYVPAGVIKLASSTERDMLFILTTGAQSNLYIYKFFWQAGQKVQSCWNQWNFDPSDTILNCECINSKLYMVIQRGTQIRFGFIDLMPLVTVPNLTFDVLLDNRVLITGVWSSTPNTTAFTLPYACNPATFNMVRSGPAFWGSNAGALVDPSTYVFSNGNKTVTIPGNATAGPVYAGENYNQVFTFSEFFQINPRTNAVIQTGRLQLKTLFVYYVNTAFFQTVVDSYGVGGAGSQQSENVSVGNFSTFDAKTVGEASLILGTPVFASGVYAFTIMGDSRTTSITLQNNSPYMSRFQGAEWEALYYNRAA